MKNFVVVFLFFSSLSYSQVSSEMTSFKNIAHCLSYIYDLEANGNLCNDDAVYFDYDSFYYAYKRLLKSVPVFPTSIETSKGVLYFYDKTHMFNEGASCYYFVNGLELKNNELAISVQSSANIKFNLNCTYQNAIWQFNP